MNRLLAPPLLVALCILTPSSAAAGSIDSSLAGTGSLSADIRRILDSPETVEGDGGPTNSRGPSFDYYDSRLGTRSASGPFEDRYGAPARPRGGDDSTASKKKHPKPGEISEPHAGWLLVAGALGLIALRRRSRNLKRSWPDA